MVKKRSSRTLNGRDDPQQNDMTAPMQLMWDTLLETDERNKLHISRVSPERLPTRTTSYQHPIHRWFTFIAGFSPEFVQACCRPFIADQKAVLLDPFAGCATAPLVACQMGMRAIGFEPHPVFSRIARAKLPGKGSLVEFELVVDAIAEGLTSPCPISLLPEVPATFLCKLFHQQTLEALLGARESLRRYNLLNNDIAFLLLSKIIDQSSHSQTDGIYKAPTSRKQATSPIDSCHKIAGMIRSDLSEMPCNGYTPQAKIIPHSSEKMAEIPDNSISMVVTSPPYLNNFDYAEMTRMLLYFWELAASWGEITELVRSKLIVNTTTALKGHKDKQDLYLNNIYPSLRKTLNSLVDSLAKQRQQRAGKKEYDYLVYPYFSQMTDVLRECHRCMRDGASMHIIVADAALYGIHISTPQILREIIEEIGFREATCSLMRKRGHRWVLEKRDGSATGLGEYHIQAIK